jgi:hypothetical protein
MERGLIARIRHEAIASQGVVNHPHGLDSRANPTCIRRERGPAAISPANKGH